MTTRFETWDLFYTDTEKFSVTVRKDGQSATVQGVYESAPGWDTDRVAVAEKVRDVPEGVKVTGVYEYADVATWDGAVQKAARVAFAKLTVDEAETPTYPEEDAPCGCLQEFDQFGWTYVAVHRSSCEHYMEDV